MQFIRSGTILLGMVLGGAPLLILFEYLRWTGTIAALIIIAGAIAGAFAAQHVIDAYPNLFSSW
jgi:hypothetical protein